MEPEDELPHFYRQAGPPKPEENISNVVHWFIQVRILIVKCNPEAIL